MTYKLQTLQYKTVAVAEYGRCVLELELTDLIRQIDVAGDVTAKTQKTVLAFFFSTISGKDVSDFESMVSSPKFQQLLDTIVKRSVFGSTPTVTILMALIDRVTHNDILKIISLLGRMFQNPSFTACNQFPIDSELSEKTTSRYNLMAIHRYMDGWLPAIETVDEAVALIKLATLLDTLLPRASGRKTDSQEGETRFFSTQKALANLSFAMLNPIALKLSLFITREGVDTTTMEQKMTDSKITKDNRGKTLLSIFTADAIATRHEASQDPNEKGVLKQAAFVFNAFLRTPQSVKRFVKAKLPTLTETEFKGVVLGILVSQCFYFMIQSSILALFNVGDNKKE